MSFYPTKVVHVILGLTLKTVILTAGAAFIVGSVIQEANGPSRNGADSEPRTPFAMLDHGRFSVILEDDETEPFSKFVLRDTRGNELMTGKLYDDNRIIFSLGDEGEAGLVRSVGYTTANGTICFGVWNGKSHYKLSACKDGSSKLELVDLDHQTHRRFHVTPGGDFVDDLPAKSSNE